MTERILTYKGVVYPWHCDHVGHMNVMWYVGKFDEATWQLFSTIGLTPDFLRGNERGMAAVKQEILYKRELMAGDVVEIYSLVSEIKDRTIRFTHEMQRSDSGELAATTELTAVHLDATIRRACLFPDSVKAKVAALFGPERVVKSS
jgi:acyl-CoA thioester hydrolase